MNRNGFFAFHTKTKHSKTKLITSSGVCLWWHRALDIPHSQTKSTSADPTPVCFAASHADDPRWLTCQTVVEWLKVSGGVCVRFGCVAAVGWTRLIRRQMRLWLRKLAWGWSRDFSGTMRIGYRRIRKLWLIYLFLLFFAFFMFAVSINVYLQSLNVSDMRKR